MRNFKLFYLAALTVSLLATSCDNDDDNTPEEVNEEEVITTLRVSLAGTAGNVLMQSVDLDGDGPNPPVVTVIGDLAANSTYEGQVTFLNETEDPAEDITVEVEEESDEHQVFFTAGGDLEVTTTYSNFDDDGNPLGTLFTLSTGDMSMGNFTVTLRHELVKPNDGLASAGGDTDIEVTFMDLEIQ